MRGRSRSRLRLATFLVLGVAGYARAETPATQTATQNPNAFIYSENRPLAPRKSLQWDADGRWTLKLDMDQTVGQPLQLKDVSAGAFFHITPSVRIGGSVGLADRFADQQKIVPQDTINAPRVRLETKFKF